MLFAASTVIGLAEQLLEQQHSGGGRTFNLFEQQLPLDTLLPLRSQGTLAPLFCIHPAGGLSWPFMGLVPHIPEGHPVYGIQARSYTNPLHNPGTLEEIALDYLDVVRSLQPTGPYLLLGWSFGGLLAFEMATRLEAAGETVALVALLDSYPIPTSSAPQTIIEDHGAVLEMLLRPLGYDESKIASHVQQLDYAAIAHMLKEDGHFPYMKAYEFENLLRVYTRTTNKNSRLYSEYRPSSSLKAEMTVFVALEENDASTAELWQPHLSGALDVHPISTTHGRMAHPAPIAEIGAVLARKLK